MRIWPILLVFLSSICFTSVSAQDSLLVVPKWRKNVKTTYLRTLITELPSDDNVSTEIDTMQYYFHIEPHYVDADSLLFDITYSAFDETDKDEPLKQMMYGLKGEIRFTYADRTLSILNSDELEQYFTKSIAKIRKKLTPDATAEAQLQNIEQVVASKDYFTYFSEIKTLMVVFNKAFTFQRYQTDSINRIGSSGKRELNIVKTGAFVDSAASAYRFKRQRIVPVNELDQSIKQQLEAQLREAYGDTLQVESIVFEDADDTPSTRIKKSIQSTHQLDDEHHELMAYTYEQVQYIFNTQIRVYKSFVRQ